MAAASCGILPQLVMRLPANAMLYVITREFLVLLLGVVLSLIVSLCTKNVQAEWKLAATILLPLGLCIVRAGWTKIPHKSCTLLRYIGASVFVAAAIVILFLFEILIGAIPNAEDALAVGLWCIAIILATAYIAAYVIAWRIGSEESIRQDTLSATRKGNEV